MKARTNSTIIVIGADHHNTLAVVRCLGRMKCKQHLLVHSSKTNFSDIHIAKSRYVKKHISVISESENSILQWLITNKTDEKQVLFPCDDLAAYTIDKNYKSLCDHYILPGFKDSPGKVSILMDKWEQNKFAK